MAAQFASVQTQNNFASSVTAITITKPTSLAVGDLMVFHTVIDSGQELTPRSDWYNLAGTVNLATKITLGSRETYVQWKMADSSDVAASNFTWNFTGSAGFNAGAILRIIGNDTSAPIGGSGAGNADDTSSPSFAIGFTPAAENSLFLMLVSSDSSSGTSGYAIATSNPTWTERYDLVAGFNLTLAGATATRTQATATGNASYTPAGASGSTDNSCFLIAVTPAPDPVLTPNSIAATSAVATPGLTVPYTATLNSITAVSAVSTPALTIKDNPWTNTDKTALPSWTNTDKS